MWNCGLLKDSQPELLREKKTERSEPNGSKCKKETKQGNRVRSALRTNKIVTVLFFAKNAESMTHILKSDCEYKPHLWPQHSRTDTTEILISKTCLEANS